MRLLGAGGAGVTVPKLQVTVLTLLGTLNVVKQ